MKNQMQNMGNMYKRVWECRSSWAQGSLIGGGWLARENHCQSWRRLLAQRSIDSAAGNFSAFIIIGAVMAQINRLWRLIGVIISQPAVAQLSDGVAIPKPCPGVTYAISKALHRRE